MNMLQKIGASIVGAARALKDPWGSPTDDGKVPSKRINWLGPRFEPNNISARATMRDVQSALRQAESGDPTSLFRFYRDSLLGDDHISGEFDKRKLAVLGQPLTVLPEDKENADDIMAASACLRAQSDCENWADGLKALLNSALWPVSVVENIYRAADPRPVRYKMPGENSRASKSFNLQYTLKRLEMVNPLLYCYRHAYLVGGVGLGTSTPIQQAQLGDINARSTPDGGNVPWYAINLDDFEPFLRLWPIDDQGRIIYDASRASKLDPDRHIVHRGHLLTEQKDNWGGPFRSILPWWLLRILGRDWFARFMERYGSPFPVGKTNAEDEQAVALLREAFENSVKIGGLVIDENDSVELQEAAVQGGAEGHERFHNVCNNAISRRIVGQDLSASAKATGMGSGVADLQANVREDIRLFDQSSLGGTCEGQVFRNLLKFNGLKGRVKVVWGGLSDEDAKTFADLLKTLNESGWEPTDEAIPTLQERFGIPVQRKAQSSSDDEDPEVGAADKLVKKLVALRADPAIARVKHPADAIAAKRAAALAAAFRGRYAPIKTIILTSSSKEEALEKMAAHFPELKAGSAAAIIEEGMQIAAATATAK